jgi:hypothetical protein
MANWVLRGLQTGIRTTAYPGRLRMARVEIGFPLSTADAFIVSAVSGT